MGGPAAHPGDWCGGHGVPESLCTRCNPELIPQFRARGDWCAEHSVPESQCTICHPELAAQGVVPPRARPNPGDEHGGDRGGAATRDGGHSEAAPGATVRLASREVAERVGIETVPAEERAVADEIAAPLRIEFDPTRLARVSARVPGVVQSLAVNVGERVTPGQLLLVLDSASAAGTRAQIQVARVRLANARAALSRLERLGPQMTTATQLEQARNEVAAAQAELSAQTATAGLVGAGGGRTVRVLAPRAGVVVARQVSQGQHVGADDVLVEVADTSAVWGILDVADLDAPRVRVGQAVAIEMEGAEGVALRASLTWLSPSVDPHTRTVQARVELPNPDGQLRANALGRARILVSAARAGVVVPRDALQRVEGRDVVFVRRSDTAFESRVVTVAARSAREVQLGAGVRAGERVVTTGSFQLKTELMRDAIGAGCCDDEG